jgi:dolichol-phosphate mannosyltransferase
MKITVIIPTFNEEENLKILLPALESVFDTIPRYDFSILVVDGASKDNTILVVKNFQIRNKNVYLLEEEKKSGLGSAYIKGFNYAMSVLKSDFVVEMDADLQHDPSDLSKLVSQIEHGYDLVIGSRYIKGGSVPASWSLNRKFISKYGSLFTAIVLRIFSIKDFSSGFKLTRVKGFLDSLDFSKLRSKGFAYKFDMLIKLFEMKARIKEVPIHFGLRDRGTSKMEKNNLRDSLRVVLSFAVDRNKNFIKFVVVGFGGLFVDLLLFNILWVILQPYYQVFDSHFYFWYFSILDPASFFSGLVAMIFTYTMNNFWSFRERKRTDLKKLVGIFVVYALFSSVPIVFRSSLVSYIVDLMGNNFLIRNFGFMIGVGFGIIWNYTIYSKVIWKKDRV